MKKIQENYLEKIAICKIKESIELRGVIYAFFSRVYKKEVDYIFIDNVKKMLPIFKKLSLELQDENLKNAVKGLENFTESINNESCVIKNLEREFVNLFLGIGSDSVNEYSCPYESVYMSSGRQVMQEAYDEVLEVYAKFGMTSKEDFKEPEDHISSELSFISRLCHIEVFEIGENNVHKAIENLKIEKEFMKNHILKWINLFCIDIKKFQKDGFYNYLADLTVAYIHIDNKFTESLILNIEYSEIFQ